MYNDLYKKFKICAEKKCGIKKDDDSKIIVAVSGGADSVCLLLLLHEFIGPERLLCAHFNHNIRGTEAERDASFTESVAKKLNTKFVLGSENVPLYAKTNNIGIEEAARILRYKFFEKIAESECKEYALVAVAHNMSDRVETVLHNIARGTSVDGLKGIEYKRGNIVRPLLDFRREEIEYICKYHALTPVFDSTNADNNYTRNKIRNIILPYLEKYFGKTLQEHIISLSNAAALDSEYMQNITSIEFNKCCNIKNYPFFKIEINKEEYAKLHTAIKKRLLRFILCMIKDNSGRTVFPGYTGIYSDMIERANAAVDFLQSGKITEISSGVICVCGYDKVYFTHKSFIENKDKVKGKILIENKNMSYDEAISILKNKSAEIEIFDEELLKETYGENYNIELRYMMEEDRFAPFGMKGEKSLRKFFIDQKIGRFERKLLPIVAIGKSILWVPGVRRSSEAPIAKKTSRVIIIKYSSDLEVEI